MGPGSTLVSSLVSGTPSSLIGTIEVVWSIWLVCVCGRTEWLVGGFASGGLGCGMSSIAIGKFRIRSGKSIFALITAARTAAWRPITINRVLGLDGRSATTGRLAA